ncbi:beta-propeller domain-containing protein [Ornithinimicrobium panacihumi]|uniref:beta-propeller domain-containing protein n=1 Tax=Ornithinimicrobium panacihumi TaxID=2008449 RepID=UPI003F8AE207
MSRSSILGLTALPLAAALTLTACAVQGPGGPGSGDKDPGGRTGMNSSNNAAAWDGAFAKGAITALPASSLAPFDDCSELLTYYQANALELVTPFGLGQGGYGWAEEDDAATAAAAATESAADGATTYTAGGGEAGTDYSTTNVQEEGVDEPDIVKTDGRIIVTVTNNKVRVVDVAEEKVVSTVSLPGRRDQVNPSEILLHGTTLVVLSQEWGQGGGIADGYFPAFNPGRTVVTTVDLTDPASPRTVGSVRIEGSYRSARLVGDTLRMVMVTDPPGVTLTAPRKGTLAAEDEALERNRELIRETTLEDWIPHRQELDGDGRTVGTEPLLACDQIARPRDPAGLSTMSVVTFDVGAANPAPTSGTGLVATGSTVYASPDRIVVGTSGWDLWAWMPEPAAASRIWPGGQPLDRTDLHTFDISDPDSTRYVASGTVEGRLVNQWALDEQDGVIRVATTTDPPGASQQSQSSLVVLREDGDQLAETGRVDGMGLTEQIQSVRYLSADLAAIVTFRQTDPLYLVDTSDPTAPQVKGELKIPGFSSYLHPVADGWLLGIGQDADEKTGETKGLQASLFDIRDLTAPRRTEVLTWENGWSPAEHDHRAFLQWPQRDLVVLPYTQWIEPVDGKEEGNNAGVALLTVKEGTLTEGPTLTTTPKKQNWGEAPMRTLVIGDQLWTLDWQGLSRFDLDSLEGGWAVDLP